MADITIPREALVKAAKVLHDHAEIFDDVPWEDLSATDQAAYIDEARSVCLALIENWPGMWRERPLEHEYLCLPLTENSNERE